MIRIFVKVVFPGGQEIFAGEIACGEPDSHGRIEGAFRYLPGYLESARASPLDPSTLPLRPDAFPCHRPQGVHAVFEDSLPDSWGRRLLIRKSRLPRKQQNIPNLLLALGATGMGALLFGDQEDIPLEDNNADLLSLDRLVETAMRYDAGEDVEEADLASLFRAGSSPGGARPKALVRDGSDRLWLAKFPSKNDRMAMVEIEAATMHLAKKAGLSVPETKMLSCGDRKVLLVERFDVTDAGRRHMTSMQTLLAAEDYYQLGYRDLFEILSLVSDQPETDMLEMFRHMVLNALIGNTDDHLKNFSVLHDDKGFFLSSAYDIMPDTENRREHVLHFDYSNYAPGAAQLAEMGAKLGVRKAKGIVETIRRTIADGKSAFEEFAVPPKDIETLSPDIKKRISKT